METFYTRYAYEFSFLWYVGLLYCVGLAIRVKTAHWPTVRRLGLIAPVVYCAFRCTCSTLRGMGHVDAADEVASLLAIVSLPLAVLVSMGIARERVDGSLHFRRGGIMADKMKDWIQAAHAALTLVLFVAVMFGGDSTRIAEGVKKAEAVLDALTKVQTDAEVAKTTSVENNVMLKSLPKQ